jgi:hypothetical protein
VKLANNNTYVKLSNKIDNLLNAIETNRDIKLPSFEYEVFNEDNDSISGLTDIPAFCLTERFFYNKLDDSIVFIKPYSFKNIEKVKHIMLSATVDENICKYIFGKDNVNFIECKYAKYKGTLNQYYDKSMSRTVIDNNPIILDIIKDKSGIKDMITFKKYGKNILYFGNAIGCNDLEGHNLNVVGTPYTIDFIYKLFAFTLGLKVDKNAVMKQCPVIRNGYLFQFTTYEDEELRNIHLWMIESEIEQAVGRARLLRYDCIVNLFSNYPIRQANMKLFHELQRVTAIEVKEKPQKAIPVSLKYPRKSIVTKLNFLTQ